MEIIEVIIIEEIIEEIIMEIIEVIIEEIILLDEQLEISEEPL